MNHRRQTEGGRKEKTKTTNLSQQGRKKGRPGIFLVLCVCGYHKCFVKILIAIENADSSCPQANCLSSLANVLTQNAPQIFVTASHQTGLDTKSMTRRTILVGVYGRGRSGTNRSWSPAGL